MTSPDLNYLFPVSRITDPKTRRALIHSFNDESAAINIVEVLIYLALSFLDMLKNHKRLLNMHNGFMEKSYEDISFGTGIVTASGAVPRREISAYVKVLEKSNLIETSRGGAETNKLFKVNLDELEKYIIEAEEVWNRKYDDYLTVRKAKREDAIRRRKANLAKGFNVEVPEDLEIAADRLNGLPDNLDFRDIRQALTGTPAEDSWRQIWIFLYYYELYKGSQYLWTGLKLAILISAWKDRPLNECSITAAISRALTPQFNDYPDFERRFRVYYSPYLKEVPEGVLYKKLI